MLTDQMLSGPAETKSLALIIYIPCLAIHCSYMFVSASCSSCIVIISAAVQATFFLWVWRASWLVLGLWRKRVVLSKQADFYQIRLASCVVVENRVVLIGSVC